MYLLTEPAQEGTYLVLVLFITFFPSCPRQETAITTDRHNADAPDNSPGHGSDVRPTVPPDLGLVVNPAEREPLKPVCVRVPRISAARRG